MISLDTDIEMCNIFGVFCTCVIGPMIMIVTWNYMVVSDRDGVIRRHTVYQMNGKVPFHRRFMFFYVLFFISMPYHPVV